MITLERFQELKRWIYLNTAGGVSYTSGVVTEAEEDLLHPLIENNIIDHDGEEAIYWPGVWEDMNNAAAIAEAVRRVNDAAMNRYESEEENGH